MMMKKRRREGGKGEEGDGGGQGTPPFITGEACRGQRESETEEEGRRRESEVDGEWARKRRKGERERPELCEKRRRETAVGILDIRENENAARGTRTAKSGEVKAIFSAERNPRKGERARIFARGEARESENGDKPRRGGPRITGVFCERQRKGAVEVA